MGSVVMGIDPGLEGACYVLQDGKKIASFIYPKKPDNTIDRYKLAGKILKLRKEHPNLFVIIERVNAMFGQSAKSTFNFGRNVEIINTILEVFKIRHMYVLPKEWQSVSWQGVNKVYKKGKTKKIVDTKRTSLMAASRIFPNDNFLGTIRSKVKHDGLIDASLLAWYGYMKGL